MIKSLILSAVALLTSLGVSSGNAQRSASVLNELKPKDAIRLNANYNDNNSQIEITASELNNYTWLNLYNLIHDNYESYTETNITYNETELSADISASVIKWWDSGTNVEISLNNDTKKFVYSSSFEYSIYFNDSSNYQALKSAIQLDVTANTSSNNENMPSIADIFGEIASSITSFITTLGSAFNGVTSLFYDATNSNFTFLGVLVLIGCGVGLVYGAYRVIKGLMHRV